VAVREIDPRTAPEADLLAIHEIEQACLPELSPGEPGRSAEETILYFRHPPATHDRHVWLHGTAGTAALHVFSPTTLFLHLFVAPDERRRGIGSALLDAVRQRCVELGLRTLHGHHATPAGAAFAARAGAVDGLRDVRCLLDLRAAELPEPHVPHGFRLVSWLAHVPDELAESFARARAAMDDAPAPDGFVFPTETVERVREMEDSLIKRDREQRVTVALDSAGEVAAFTDLRVSRGSTVGFTDDTGTVAAHRGRGLARAVKLESLRRLRADHPQIELVTTMNAEENLVMRHINERIGFVPTATLTTAALTLEVVPR
jgi:GNAT superfamily N-acetyltransferase